MFDIRKVTNGNPFENDLEDEHPSSCPSANGKRTRAFIKIPIVITCTIIVFILLIAGTATTAISFPPKPPQWNPEDYNSDALTALGGDQKLIGPLLLTAGIFLLIVDVILCTIVTKEAYIASRSIQPTNMDLPKAGSVSVLGGPFYLATPNPTVNNPNSMVPFAFSRHLWTLPNAPTADFFFEDETMKASKLASATATITETTQPPYNPDAKPQDDE